MKQCLIGAIVVLSLLMSPMFSTTVHATPADKLVSIPGDAAYSGTYAYQGTRNAYPYYKHSTQAYYLYVDSYCGTWTLWVIGGLQTNPDAGVAKYYQYPLSSNPGDAQWYESLPNTPVSISITDASAGVAPTVSTEEATLVTTTSGTMNGNILADGGATASRGFVYSSTDATPTIGETGVTQVAKGTGTGTYTELVGSLTPGATVYYQAYGTNTYGTAYGGIKSFTTPTASQPNKLVSGIGTPAAANGVYVWIGNYYGKPAWKHQTSNYWLYYSRYGNTYPSTYYWYIDGALRNEHGAEDYLFSHVDAATCPSTGWTAKTGTGTPSVVDYPNIAFTNGTTYSPASPTAGTNNSPVGRFQLSGELAGASLTAATITVSGTRTVVTNLKLWSSTDSTFNSGSDTQLNSQSDGSTVTFSGFSSAISTSGTYYFVTTDLGVAASGSFALTIGSKANLTISGGAIASDFSNAALSSGTVTIASVSEMNVKGNAVSIADGDTTPSSADGTEFGVADVVTGTVEHTFTIENLGGAELTLIGDPKVAISGANATDFSVDVQPDPSVDALSGTTTFKVTFNPSGSGTRSATLSIANNDSNENPYNFAIQGSGDGEMQCGGVGTYTFSTQSGVVIQVANTGTNFGCLLVEETDGDHPYATGVVSGSGTKTGKYWSLEALRSDATTTATEDYLISVTLPHDIAPDTNAQVCKYTGGSGYGWDCGRTSSTATTVTRNEISSLSEWAVGNEVGPTSLAMTGTTARQESGSALPVLLIGLSLVALAGLALRRRVQQ